MDMTFISLVVIEMVCAAYIDKKRLYNMLVLENERNIET